MVNLANVKMQIWSTDMTDEERKTWKTEEDICPICQKKFGSYKQCKTGKNMFINSSVPLGTIIHKKCCGREPIEETQKDEGQRYYY